MRLRDRCTLTDIRTGLAVPLPSKGFMVQFEHAMRDRTSSRQSGTLDCASATARFRTECCQFQEAVMFFGDWLQRREMLSPNKIARIDAINDNPPITYREGITPSWACSRI